VASKHIHPAATSYVMGMAVPAGMREARCCGHYLGSLALHIRVVGGRPARGVSNGLESPLLHLQCAFSSNRTATGIIIVSTCARYPKRGILSVSYFWEVPSLKCPTFNQ
jgi:hypothetical protein